FPISQLPSSLPIAPRLQYSITPCSLRLRPPPGLRPRPRAGGWGGAPAGAGGGAVLGDGGGFHRLRRGAGDAEVYPVRGETGAPGLNLFDARRSLQAWARPAPVFWGGAGRNLAPGEEGEIRAVFRFTPLAGAASTVRGALEAPGRLIPLRPAKAPLWSTPA